MIHILLLTIDVPSSFDSPPPPGPTTDPDLLSPTDPIYLRVYTPPYPYAYMRTSIHCSLHLYIVLYIVVHRFL